MNGLHIEISNKPIPSKPACCSEPGCKYEANRVWLLSKWLCNWHYYRRVQALNGDAA